MSAPHGERIERPATVGDAVYDRLRHGLLLGRWQPGERLREDELAGAFGVSRTPVREAVRRLLQEGLLEARPNAGVRVRRLEPSEALDAFDVREELEGMAARLAASRGGPATGAELAALLARVEEASAQGDLAEQVEADLAFHRRIAELSANAPLIRSLETLAGHVTPLKILTRDQNAAHHTRQQHRALADAIEHGDPAGAEAAARAHVRTFKGLLAERLAPRGAETPA